MNLGIKTALVTGASTGIGRSYCQALAKLGVDLILVARNQSKLQQLAEELAKKHGVKAWVFPQDLADQAAPARIFEFTQSNSLQVDLLINNAGYADLASFMEIDWLAHADMLQVMLRSVVQLCHLYMPLMLDNKQGAIINVGSIASLMNFKIKGRPNRTLYRPIKAFVVAFTEKLASIYSDSGIRFQCLCPGLTYSEFHQRSGESSLYTSTHKWMWLQADTVVNKSLNTLMKGKKIVVVPGWCNRLIIYLYRLFSVFH